MNPLPTQHEDKTPSTFDNSPDPVEALYIECPSISLSEFRTRVALYAEAVAAQTAKAYGGCTNCFGKGYATYINGTTAYSDFGDELGGDYSRHTDKLEMRFCTCDRGKQLEQLASKALGTSPTNPELTDMSVGNPTNGEGVV